MREWLLAHITLKPPETAAEERANGVTHLLGFALSVVGLGALVAHTLGAGDRISLVGAVVYGLSMVALYGASSAYHLTQGAVSKRLFRALDHLSIYFLIAGTYTPITLALRGPVGWALFAAIWTMAALGIAFTFLFWGRLRWLHVVLYVATGWTAVFAWREILAMFPRALIGWMLAGGVVYTLGAVVYALKLFRFHHAVWHLFVLGGSLCFFVGIYRYAVSVAFMPL